VSAGTRAALDRVLYALFSQHSDERRHDADRRHYRGTAVTTSFDVYLARVYGLSWIAGLLLASVALFVLLALSPAVYDRAAATLARVVPYVRSIPRVYVAGGGALLAGALGKRATVRLGGAYLRWSARARRSAIERTLPGAVRYLRALASGSEDGRAMLQRVASQDAYGETAVAFRTVLNRTTLTGSFDTAVRLVARDTPSQDLLAPFLLKFREYAAQGGDAVEDYLRLESQMLGRRQNRQRQQAEGFLELLAELFIVLLVLPTLLIIVLTVLAVLAPGLSRPVETPLGTTSPRVVLVYGSAAFALFVGALSAWLVRRLRPPNVAETSYERARGWGLLRTALSNPASAAVVALPLGVGVAGLLWRAGLDPVNVVLLGYAAYGLPVGLVAVRRARLDEAKDREIKDFVHAVAGHVSLGRPFPEAVELVARDVDLGALDPDVADLAFNLDVTTREEDTRTAALTRFVERVGTPLAHQTIGLVTGALDAGSDPQTVFDTLQAEIGRLYHEKKALRANLLVYVAVGWTTALLVVGVMVAVNLYVLDSFEQLATVSQSMDGVALDPGAVAPSRDRYRFYVVTQATMLASGWFAGYANRGRYEALLHSSALVVLAFAVFVGAGAL
jgi:archaellum biogenesis protein FlaJ (TadC family)